MRTGGQFVAASPPDERKGCALPADAKKSEATPPASGVAAEFS
jgi:hypothetical protein